MDRSAIEWCDSTFNPWIGCTKVSPACDHCYAEAQMSTRLGRVQWGAGKQRQRTSVGNWRQPVRWNARSFWQCDTCGWRGENPHLDGLLDEGAQVRNMCPGCWPALVAVKPARRRVFCASLADVFDNEVPTSWRVDLLRLIEATPNLDWLLLTKRIGNVERMLDDAAQLMPEVLRWPPPNVWLGATICNQSEADRDIPRLLAVPARVRFLSIEPMLGPIDLTDIVVRHRGGTEDHFSALYDPDDDDADTASYIDWVICGGESGPHARPMHPDWVRSLRDQCGAAGVPFLFKQWGEWIPPDQQHGGPLFMSRADQITHERSGRFCVVGGMPFWKIGKRAAGRLLDGKEHNGFPVVTP